MAFHSLLERETGREHEIMSDCLYLRKKDKGTKTLEAGQWAAIEGHRSLVTCSFVSSSGNMRTAARGDGAARLLHLDLTVAPLGTMSFPGQAAPVLLSSLVTLHSIYHRYGEQMSKRS